MARTFFTQFKRQRQLLGSARGRKGFVIVSTLFLVTMLLATLSGLVFLSISIRNRTALLSSCRKIVVDAQSSMANDLSALISLNSKAQSLRLQRQFAETQVRNARLSMNPKLIAAAELFRNQVIQSQLLLRAKQLGLLGQARATRHHVRAIFSRIRTPAAVRQLRSINLETDLAVEPNPKGDLTPNYVLSPAFAQEQRLGLSWTFNLLEGLPLGFRLHSIPESLISKAHCVATLKRKDKLWIPTLAVAKF